MRSRRYKNVLRNMFLVTYSGYTASHSYAPSKFCVKCYVTDWYKTDRDCVRNICVMPHDNTIANVTGLCGMEEVTSKMGADLNGIGFQSLVELGSYPQVWNKSTFPDLRGLESWKKESGKHDNFEPIRSRYTVMKQNKIYIEKSMKTY